MKRRLEIQTEPAELNLTDQNWTTSSRAFRTRTQKFRENPGTTTTKYPKTKSHAEIMRTSMKTFLTDLNIPYPPQRANRNEAENDPDKSLRKSQTRFAPECRFFLKRVDEARIL